MAFSSRCVAVALALVLLVAAACSDDKKPAAASSSSSSSSAPPTTASTTTSTSSSAATGCDAAPPPATAVRVQSGQGDFNGDKAVDTISVYGSGTESNPAPIHLNMVLGNSVGTIDVVIPDADAGGVSALRPLGTADITASAGLPPDGSGNEAFVVVGSGASTNLVAVLQLVGCTLTRVKDVRGQPSSFPIGGSVTHLGGLRCDGTAGGQRLVQLSATSDDGITYATTETRMDVVNGQFTATNTVNGSVTTDDPTFHEFGSINCSGVETP